MLTTLVQAPHCQPVGHTNAVPAAARRLTRMSVTPQCVQPLVFGTSPSTSKEPLGSDTTCGNRLLGLTIGVRYSFQVALPGPASR